MLKEFLCQARMHLRKNYKEKDTLRLHEVRGEVVERRHLSSLASGRDFGAAGSGNNGCLNCWTGSSESSSSSSDSIIKY